ncbi:MAG: hypothetical protein M0R31_11430 [Candidatus Riflebacteria bacterium]|nr:hypothetical protein [Candidatus Riflebacteria bacterium]
MREASDLGIGAGIRRELAGRRVDLSKIKFPVMAGVVTLEGELSFVGLSKTIDETAIELKFIESSIRSIAGVKEINFALSNWAKSEAGVWECESAKSGSPIRVEGEGIVCSECDYVIRFCPCCGKPIGEAKHGSASSASKQRRPVPPIKPIIRKKRPLTAPPLMPIDGSDTQNTVIRNIPPAPPVAPVITPPPATANVAPVIPIAPITSAIPVAPVTPVTQAPRVASQVSAGSPEPIVPAFSAPIVTPQPSDIIENLPASATYPIEAEPDSALADSAPTDSALADFNFSDLNIPAQDSQDDQAPQDVMPQQDFALDNNILADEEKPETDNSQTFDSINPFGSLNIDEPYAPSKPALASEKKVEDPFAGFALSEIDSTPTSPQADDPFAGFAIPENIDSLPANIVPAEPEANPPTLNSPPPVSLPPKQKPSMKVPDFNFDELLSGISEPQSESKDANEGEPPVFDIGDLNLDDDTPLPPMKKPAPEKPKNLLKDKNPFGNIDLDLDLEIISTGDSQDSQPSSMNKPTKKAPAQNDDNPFGLNTIIDLDAEPSEADNTKKKTKSPFNLDDFDLSKFKI